jgi:malonyl-ACP decarboxylase
MSDAIYVTGLGVVAGPSVGVARFTRQLLDGETAVRTDAEPAAGDVPPPACRAPLPALMLDERLARWGAASGPATRCTLAAAAEAWGQAGSPVDRGRTGIVIAGSNLDPAEIIEQQARAAAGGNVRPSHAARHLDSFYAGLIGEALSISGEGYSVGGASASGGVALALARRAIRSGDVDSVLVVAPPTMLSAVELAAFEAIGALRRGSTGVYQPFERGGTGFCYGQAAAAMVIARGDGVAKGTALARLDGAAMVLDPTRSTDPTLDGELKAMRAALAQAGRAIADIDLVSAHATGTAAGDRVEAEAIAQLCGEREASPTVVATKALTGHCLHGAGLIEAIACVLQIRHGFVHANPFLTDPIDPRLRYAPRTAARRPVRTALSNSFGFGGINTAQLFSALEEAGDDKPLVG